MKKLEYIDNRGVFFTSLTYYKGGVRLPSKTNILKCTDDEAKSLLKNHKNGSKPCFKEVKPPVVRKKEEKIINNLEE